MVLALSPRLKKFNQDALLHARVLALQKEGRLEMALQIPNAPFFPLIVDTNSAKDAVPPGAPLPNPPFAYPDDVIHLVASAKADFFHVWRTLPRGLVLPLGAASPSLLGVLDKLGFAWVVGAIEAPAVDGPYKAGAFALWDATPAMEPVGTRVQVWDERSMKDRKVFAGWVQELDRTPNVALLPSDPDLPSHPLPADTGWLRRTWTTRDWTNWIGQPRKNLGWEWLRQTREALERYKNSGQASVQRLDMAFEQIYAAENANYFAALGNETLPPQAAEDREHELQATLSAVYKLMGEKMPDALFAQLPAAAGPARALASASVSEVLPDGTEHVALEDPAGDDHGDGRLPDPPGGLPAGSYDLRRFEVFASSSNYRFVVTLGAFNGLGRARKPGPLLDVYIDQNHQPNIGTSAFLPGRGFQASVTDAWEYAMTLAGDQARIYRTTGSGTFELAYVSHIAAQGAGMEWTVPQALLRGSPRRWSYQVLVMAYDAASPESDARPFSVAGASPINDLLDPPHIAQSVLLGESAEGKRNDVPLVRPRSEQARP
jgi:hypothetical protein